MSTNRFLANTTFEKRYEYSATIRKNYPNMVPIILSTSAKDKVVKLTKSKYLVPQDLSLAKVMGNVRKYTNIDETQSIFLLIGNHVIPKLDSTAGELYSKYKDDDGFLYITVSIENTFGTICPFM